MKKPPIKIHPEYIIDKSGKEKVLLDVSTFEEILERLENLYFGSLALEALEEDDEFVDFFEANKKILK